MSNADREFELRCSWWAIGFLACLFSVAPCVFGIAAALGIRPEYRVLGVAARIGILCLCEAEAVLFGFMAIRLTTRRVGRRQRLVFTDTAIIITDGPHLWSRKPKSVPYADVRKARHTTIGQMRTIKIAFAGGPFRINPHLLPRKTDFDELLSELTRRLKQFGMEVETREYSLRRPQFSLRFMFVITAVVAAGLGLCRCLDPDFHLHDLVTVLCCTLWILLTSLIVFGNWSARIFALGFALGMILELDLVFPAVGGTIPQGPYSSTMIFKQMLMIPGDLFWADSFYWLLLGGITISGIVGGTVAMLAWLVGRRVIRAGSNPDVPGGSP